MLAAQGVVAEQAVELLGPFLEVPAEDLPAAEQAAAYARWVKTIGYLDKVLGIHIRTMTLSQDLGILSRLASDWAIHLNMEVSRGTTPDDSENQARYDNEELRKRVMGGVSVSF